MNMHSELLIQLLWAAIRGQSGSTIEISKTTDWFSIYKEAKEHQVHTLLYPLIERLPLDKQPETNLLTTWKKDTLLEASSQIAHINQMSQVLNNFRTRGIAVIALKGLVLRNYYPFPDLRTMGDADILVHEEDLTESKKLLTLLGYQEGTHGIKHIEFKHADFPTIELHWVITNNEGKENILSFTSLAWRNAVNANIGDAPCFSLSIEDQILHLLLHSVSHMIGGGFGLRQVCDLVLAIEANKTPIDWDKILWYAESYQIRKFTITLLSLCSKYFHLEIPDFPLYSTKEAPGGTAMNSSCAELSSPKENADSIDISRFLNESISKESAHFLREPSPSEQLPEFVDPNIMKFTMHIDSSSEETYIDMLLQDILNAGVFGKRTSTRETSGRVSKYIDVMNSQRKFASILNFILFLFPPADKLAFRYNYARKRYYLLPLAWVHRGIHNVKKLGSLRFTLNKDIEAASKERAKLLHWLQLR